MTMKLISTVTVGAGGAASIEFTGIPQTGTDLLVVLSVRSNEAGDPSSLYATVNNAFTGTYRMLYGSGANSFSQTDSYGSRVFVNGNTFTSNTFSNVSFYFPNYTSTANKSVSVDAVAENNATAAYRTILAGSYTSSVAITSLQFPLANWMQYSTASLYTVTKGSGGASVS